MSGFYRALPLVLEAEGGLVDNPDDRGGRTNYGVTQATYDEWRDSSGEPRRPVDAIELAEVHAIYHQRYWLPAHCEALPWPVSHLHFDAAVNHGVKQAVKLLQRALDVTPDGEWGPITQSAANLAAPDDLIPRMLWGRVAFYVQLAGKPGQSRFLRGWLNRLLKLRRWYA